ncbi:hypothetical protein SS50377_21605 [Spironucleus salmonicida]|uniref:Uncharacterized protein n=1 Tax=Spironucleus salmonicida TaxID=348837 RepID=A0A9P8LX70_9EUKA|nr:hypothetical protein SS50377_21591 [Spironucleus salmonicida]KAH0576063.1 hypothetical protein SS50377_21605 [Spironucleus salmonicida]
MNVLQQKFEIARKTQTSFASLPAAHDTDFLLANSTRDLEREHQKFEELNAFSAYYQQGQMLNFDYLDE